MKNRTNHTLTTCIVALAILVPVAAAKPLKVFILSGQSNMQGHAQLSTFDVIGLDPQTAPMLAEMRNADGTPRVCEDVWISSIGSADDEQVGKLTAGFGAAQRGCRRSARSSPSGSTCRNFSTSQS